ncbi:MAG TPA: DUF951 domain-containing protein [Hungateiclostridium thermocellum]|jgi:hypothetical protein|uniref:DUF951 domain-containing protein n=2 Tax=Acetivibrio thermocellus TaxID=1515 RepID=A3DID5_ACET2|nr:DUF951 domain-containing protein [Acetivibrio thermocellus]CDG36987.1 hypothetical protein CTHBC1_2395 [Acetivibrio thermocellus BC1]ABN53714.1 protein of unknown function DUF951 [Acetivibrio thermocellus ATCC 27405]ADU73192.1 protein of unknown function DUF951 [Acetivibrio thermocellus DSM 1313]ALX07107.1 protein of unknown function DUF951 [Acetivibrio thermocellus AD2]ANV74843.1 protein of unknown function DUF951 [Acetivibrio thermocellus DSM 2360]
MEHRYRIGEIVELKKQHPCGSKQWEITRVGADFKIKCLGCQHQVMLPRPKFEKSVKKIIRSLEEDL